MSNQAHRIVKIVHAKQVSFQAEGIIGHKLLFLETLNLGGGGYVTLQVDEIEELLEEAKDDKGNQYDPDELKALAADVKAARKRGDDSIDYDIF